MNTDKPADTIDSILSNGLVAPSLIEIAENFIHAQKDSEEVAWSENADSLLNVTENIFRNFLDRPFSLVDFLIMAAHLDIKNEIAKSFFEDVVNCLLKNSRLTVIETANSCYGFPSYILK